MVTWGQKLFQSGYLDVSSRTAQTREAGAEIAVEAEVGRMTDSRGTRGVVRPLGGGHVDVVALLILNIVCSLF